MQAVGHSVTDRTVISCHLRYRIDPYKLDAFEDYARRWIRIVTRMGGWHHGYWLPDEGANDVAVAIFSFPSLAAYERYRQAMRTDPECQEAYARAELERCIQSYERSFMRPVGVSGGGTGRSSS